MVKVISPRIEILTDIDQNNILQKLEKAGRICYKSEERITPSSAQKFIETLINKGHLSVIEHENISVKFVCDRGITHELVRHRLASYSQESSRYVNYSHDKKNGKGITVIKPLFFEENSEKYSIWLQAMNNAEQSYLKLTDAGASAQEARSVLPHSVKTEIIMTTNLRQWRHIFEMRCVKAAHPQMREVMKILLKELIEKLPVIFSDLSYLL